MRLVLASLACAIALGSPATAPAARPTETYIFMVSRVDLKKGVPPEVEKQIATRLDKTIADHAEIDGSLAAGAPSPDTRPADFKSYLKKHRQRAFKVNVEVTEYTSEVAPRAAVNILTVRIGLRIFGETVPDRVMAFTGDGVATVKVEIGKKLRAQDQAYANDQAIELAVADALATSIKRLREAPQSQKKKRTKK